jgi:deoxyadenosine/deoxycytidine kinase
MFPSLKIDTWEKESLSALTAKILNITPKPLILIDGKGGSGKTSVANKLAVLLNANIVSTDDVCWCADPIHWDGEMLKLYYDRDCRKIKNFKTRFQVYGLNYRST